MLFHCLHLTFNLTLLSFCHLAQLFFSLSLLLHSVISVLCLVSLPPSLPLHLFPLQLFLPFLLSSPPPLPPSLCPQALAADCVVWRLNEAVLIQ